MYGTFCRRPSVVSSELVAFVVMYPLNRLISQTKCCIEWTTRFLWLTFDALCFFPYAAVSWLSLNLFYSSISISPKNVWAHNINVWALSAITAGSGTQLASALISSVGNTVKAETSSNVKENGSSAVVCYSPWCEPEWVNWRCRKKPPNGEPYKDKLGCNIQPDCDCSKRISSNGILHPNFTCTQKWGCGGATQKGKYHISGEAQRGFCKKPKHMMLAAP
jgi:hypothetical protein